MKKILWIAISVFLSSSLLQAQTSDDEISRQMEKMAKEMEKMLENFGFTDQNSLFKIDTLFFKGGEMPGMSEEFFHNFQFDQDLSTDMLELMEKQILPFFNNADAQNQLDSLFRQFSFPMPETPEGGNAGEKKKKRKVYTL